MNMPHDDSGHHRRSIRLQAYDYSQAGAYFVTICGQDRVCLFGDIDSGEMILNESGRLVRDEWLKTFEIRTEIQSGEFVVMPNHFHGILIIDADICRGTARRAPTAERFGRPISGSLPTIVRAFKSAVTKRINEIRKSPGIPVWQRNYYEHVIRNEDDYRKIAEYIADNPRRWEEDTLHPDM
jgi:REP element-mobilizing transposase RayT